LVGFTFGLFLAQQHLKSNGDSLHSRKAPCSLKTARLLHYLSIALLLVIAFSLYPWNAGWNVPTIVTALYASSIRTVWSTALCGFLYYLCVPLSPTCSSTSRGFTYELLCWNGFQFTSRLSYCMYLLHPVVIWLHYAYSSTPLPSTAFHFARFFAANFFITQLLAIVFCLLFESPINRIQRLMMRSSLVEKSQRATHPQKVESIAEQNV
jgi:peptidoglycan/LPS O-acetylase OafA/YrhL